MISIYIENRRDMFWQWDVGQRVELNDVSAGTKVHFSNAISKTDALVVQSYDDGDIVYADVPNVLLQTAGNLSVYVYVENEDESHTEFRKRFAVRERERPSDYVYTETDVLTWRSLEKRISDLETALEAPDNDVTDMDALYLAHETGLIEPVEDEGYILTDENDEVYVL